MRDLHRMSRTLFSRRPIGGSPTRSDGNVDLAMSSGDDAKLWMKVLSAYRDPNRARSAFELVITAIPFAAIWIAASFSVTQGHWWGVFLDLPATAFLLRLFMIQHDCGHGSFFAQRSLDDWTGRLIGVLTLTPYDYWRRAHAQHHASAGNLDQRGVGDITTLTIRGFDGLSRWGRLRYRLYRHPAVMFGIGPAWLFLFQHRLPFGMFRGGYLPWISTMATNVAIAAAAGVLIWILGLTAFLAVHLPIMLMAAAAGVWLFYIQHQFEETHWSGKPEWQFQHAALHGASHYDLPVVLRWITANIGVHHVHHLASKIPYYRLPEVLRNHPELAEIGKIDLIGSLRCVDLVLWDEVGGRLVSFREAATLAVTQTP